MPRSKTVISRRSFVAGSSAACIGASLPATAQSGLVVSVADFGARAGGDANGAIQRALDHLAQRGGGVLRIGGSYRGGPLAVRGGNITIDGTGGTLLDTRISIAPEAHGIVIRDLTLLETRGRSEHYLLNVAGQNCLFSNLSLIKRPAAGGYQAYLRHQSRGCRFDGLRLTGSNGIFVAGQGHVFENFELESTMRHDVGGDDAFAIKGAGTETRDIMIRRGIVRGYAAAVSIGSEVGWSPEHRGRGSVVGVRVSDIVADRCSRVCFIKPGALIYDWRDGLVSDVTLDAITLTDRAGARFVGGIVIVAGRGATVRRVRARNVRIEARSSSARRQTAAVDITTGPLGAPSTIRDIDLQVLFDGEGRSGLAVDHIVRIEKADPAGGSISGVELDVVGKVSRISGIHVGGGLDGGVTVRRAQLSQIALAPPSVLGAAGIWADSAIKLVDVSLDVARGPQFAGKALLRR